MSDHDDIRMIDTDAALALQEIVNCIENLEREKKGLMEDIREKFKEAKEQNFDVATIKDILKRRKLSSQQIQEKEYLLDAYETALKMKAEKDSRAA